MQTITLNLIPGAVLPVVNVSQADTGRQFKCAIMDGTSAASLSGKTVKISGRKADGHAYQYSSSDRVGTVPVVQVSGNEVTITTPMQMTAAKGKALVTLTISGSGNEVSTLNFYMDVQENPIADADISDSDLPDIIALATEQMVRAEAAAAQASTSATTATSAAGTATTAKNNAVTAKDQAVSAKNDAQAAAQTATQASLHPPYIGANGNWYVWNTATGQYVDSGVDASITIRIGSTSTLPAGSNATVTNSGTSTDPIFNFGIPQGLKGDTGNTGPQGAKGDKGDKGDTGNTGPQGPKGDKGESGYGVYVEDHGLILVGSAEVINHGLVLG